jgi:hypothetical protein
MPLPIMDLAAGTAILPSGAFAELLPCYRRGSYNPCVTWSLDPFFPSWRP